MAQLTGMMAGIGADNELSEEDIEEAMLQNK
jgi:hypothetical protein